MSIDRRKVRPDIIGKMIPEPGGRLRYRIDYPIGTGGQAWVYRATDENLKRPVAIKILKPDEAQGFSQGYEQRFEQEAVMTARLRGPHTVTLFDHGTVTLGGFDYIIMVSEFIDGITLHRHIQTQGSLTPKECVLLLSQVAESLSEAHGHGFIHRDLKSMNVMVESGEKFVVKVLDFGIGKAIHDGSEWDQNLTAKGDNFLSPMFAAPEQIMGGRPGPATDLYALGVIGYHCMVGQHPYHHLAGVENPHMAVLGHVVSQELVRLPEELGSAPLAGIIHKLLEKDIPRRYQTCQELLRDLGNLETAEQRQERLTRRQAAIRRDESEANLATQPLGDPTAPLPEPTERLAQFMPTVLEQPHATVRQPEFAESVAEREFDSTRAIRSGAFDPMEDRKTDAFMAPTPEAIRDAELEVARKREEASLPVAQVVQVAEPAAASPGEPVASAPPADEGDDASWSFEQQRPVSPTERVFDGGESRGAGTAKIVALLLVVACLGVGGAVFSGAFDGPRASDATPSGAAQATTSPAKAQTTPVEKPEVAPASQAPTPKPSAPEATAARTPLVEASPLASKPAAERAEGGVGGKSDSGKKAKKRRPSKAKKPVEEVRVSSKDETKAVTKAPEPKKEEKVEEKEPKVVKKPDPLDPPRAVKPAKVEETKKKDTEEKSEFFGVD